MRVAVTAAEAELSLAMPARYAEKADQYTTSPHLRPAWDVSRSSAVNDQIAGTTMTIDR